MHNFIDVIFKRERQYYKSNWQILTALVVILTALMSLLIFLPLNDINNFNNSIPYHMQVENASKQMVSKMKKMDNIAEVGIRSNLFMAKNINSSIEYYDKTAMKLNNIILKEGKLPSKFDEVISTNIKKNLGEKINVQWIARDGKLKSQEFEIVGIAKNHLVSERNNDIVIVSDTFASQNNIGDVDLEAYVLLDSTKQEEIDAVKKQMGKIGIETKNIHVNTYYLYGLLGNKTQLLVLCMFGVGIIFLCKSLISAIYTIFIEEDKEYFYKLKVLGLSSGQFNKLIKKRFLYLIRVTGITLFFLFIITTILFKFFEIPYSKMIFGYVSIYVFSAMFFALRVIFSNKTNYVKENSKYSCGYDLSNLRINKKILNINVKSLAKRNHLVYKKRYRAILKSMSIVMIFFIMIGTAFNSINLPDRLRQVFQYDESFIIYPEMNNQYNQIDQFQDKNPFNENFIDRLNSINGVKKIIYNKRIFAEIKNSAGESYKEIFEIINSEKKHEMEKNLIEGDLNNSGIILNGDKLSKEGISCNIGDVLTLVEKEGKKIEIPVVAVVNNSNSREEIYITDDIISSLVREKNYIYSISILCENNYKHNEIKNNLEILLSDYPSLQIRDYYVQLNNLNDTFRSVYLSLSGILIILLLISVASFINIERVNLLQRKKEFALLQINGMHKDDILKSVLYEGFGYIKKIILIVPLLSIALSYIFVFSLNKFAKLSFLKYNYSLISLLLVIVLISAIVVVISCYEISRQNKENIIERVHL